MMGGDGRLARDQETKAYLSVLQPCPTCVPAPLPLLPPALQHPHRDGRDGQARGLWRCVHGRGEGVEGGMAATLLPSCCCEQPPPSRRTARTSSPTLRERPPSSRQRSSRSSLARHTRASQSTSGVRMGGEEDRGIGLMRLYSLPPHPPARSPGRDAAYDGRGRAALHGRQRVPARREAQAPGVQAAGRRRGRPAPAQPHQPLPRQGEGGEDDAGQEGVRPMNAVSPRSLPLGRTRPSARRWRR